MADAKFFTAELIERIDFSEDLGMFRFRPDGEFTFIPGQYVSIGMPKGEKLIQRPYSILSSPYETDLEFYIELVPEGALTPLLWELKVGDTVMIRRRFVGKFLLDDKQGLTKHLMGATVTGLAPFLSMARKQLSDLKNGQMSQPHRFCIIHGASRSWELGIYLEELRALAAEEWMDYIATVSRPWEDPEWNGECGRVEDVIRKYADSLGFNADTVGYSCGHPDMIQNVSGIMKRCGFPKERIKEEKYF